MEMIFRFSGDGKLVHATGPPQAKIWKIVRAFATNCTCFCYKLYVVLVFVLKKSIISLDRGRTTRNSDSTCKDTSIKHLKIEIEFSGVGRS